MRAYGHLYFRRQLKEFLAHFQRFIDSLLGNTMVLHY